MAETFETLWKRLLVYAPDIPLPLAQEWVNTAYSRILTKHNWSGLRGEAEFVIPPSYVTGTVTTTQSSLGVVGVGTTWTSAMIGRQFLVGSAGPFYTITDVPTTTSLTLDRAYGGASGALQTYDILQVYLPGPSDFLQFQAVLDRTNNWRLHTNYRQETIDTWDSKRSVGGTPTILAVAPNSPSGGIRFEIWPRIASGKTYSYRYVKKLPLLVNASDTLINPISGYAILQGALSELTMWPGLKNSKNMAFDPNGHTMRESAFKEEVQGLLLEDQRIIQDMITYEGWDNIPYAPIDASYMQTHDIY